MLGRIFAQRRARHFFSTFSPGTTKLQQDRRLISLFSLAEVGSVGEMYQSFIHGNNFSGKPYQGSIFQGNAPRRDSELPGRIFPGNAPRRDSELPGRIFPGNAPRRDSELPERMFPANVPRRDSEIPGRIFPGNAPIRDSELPERTFQGNSNFVRNALEDYEQWEQKRLHVEKNIVHFTLKNKNIFISVTDDKGNKKLGASAGCLKEIQGGSRRRTKYAVEATAEHVGRASRVLGMKSVVVRVKGSSYFGKKKAAVLSFRKGLGTRSSIMSIEDVTQLPHNGCRLPKRRRY